MRPTSRNAYPAISFNDGARTASANGDSYVDLQGYEGALIVIASGTITDGTSYEFELKECATSGGTYTAVADADLVSGGPTAGDLEPTFLAAQDDTVKWFGYSGSLRYIRIDLKTVVGSPSTGGEFVGLVIKGLERHKPAI